MTEDRRTPEQIQFDQDLDVFLGSRLLAGVSPALALASLLCASAYIARAMLLSASQFCHFASVAYDNSIEYEQTQKAMN